MAKRTVPDWEPETRSLLQALVAAGFKLTQVTDGGGKWEPFENEDQAVDVLTCTDETGLRVELGDFYSTIFLVLGNSPGELVNDWSWPGAQEGSDEHKLLDVTLEAEADKWDGREQPRKEV